MKKITLLITLFIFAFTWQGNAQFSEDFEGGVPGAFTEAINSGSTSWGDCASGSVGSQTCPITGNTSASFYTSNYNGDSATLTTPSMDLSAGGFLLKFDHSQQDWSTDQNTLLVEISTDGGANYSTIVDFTASLTSVTSESFMLDSYSTTATTIIRFTATSDYGYSIILDNVEVVTAPSCIEPTALIASATSLTNATLSWSAAGSETNWTYEYGATGFSQGSGTGNVVSTTSVNLTGLTAGNSYDFYVQANCGALDGDSAWSGPFTWTQPNVGDSCAAPYSLTVEADCTTATPFALDYATASDTGFVTTCDGFGVNTGAWFEFTAPASGSFTLSMSLSSEHAIFDACGGTELVCAAEGTGTTYSGLTGGAVYKMVVWKDGATTGVNNICLEEVTCLFPTALSATTTTVTADLSWTAGASETMWNYEYGLSGYTQGDVAGILGSSALTTTNVAISGLTQATSYDYYVQADCGGNTSVWSGPFNFTTLSTTVDCATSNFPADAATNVSFGCGSSVTLTWSPPSGVNLVPDSYDVYFGTATNPSFLANTTDEFYTVSVNPSTNYFYKIVPKSGTTEATTCTEITFTTDAATSDGGSGGTTNTYFFANNNYTGGTPANAYSYDDPVAAGHTLVTEPLTSGANDFDDGYQTVTLPFTFRYYGVDYTEAHMGTNGYLSFGIGYTVTGGSTTLGSTSNPDNMIAVAMMDLDDRADGKLYYGPIGTDKFAFTWYHYHDFSDDNEWITVQLVLQKNTDPAVNGSFEIRYNQAESSASIPDILSDAVIGCEDVDANTTTEFATYRSNGTGGPIFCSPLTIGFGPSATAVVLAVEDISSIEGFSIYPNPVKGLLNFKSRNNIDSVSIYNILGQEVIRTHPNTSETQIDVDDLPTGVYVVKVKVGEKVGSYRVIKE